MPNMESLTSVMSRRSIDLKWVHIQGQREIRYNHMPFSTKDRDNDGASSFDCATNYHGAWWYGSCLYSNLNGQYYDKKRMDSKGVVWHAFRQWNTIKFTEMKLRTSS